MAKKFFLNVIIVVTFMICVGIILFVALPHHTVTASEAVDLACNYFNYRMDDSLEIESAYVIGAEKTFVKQIVDYWNPMIKHYEVKIKTKPIDAVFMIYVDAFTGYVYDGTEGIRWKK